MPNPLLAVFRKPFRALTPIPEVNRKAPYCVAFHTGVCIDPNKDVRPCCQFVGSIGNLNENSLVEIMAGEKWTADKQLIERGETPEGCRLCRKREEMTGWSTRKLRFEVRQSQDTGWSRGITQLELNTTNVCNLRCTHCNPDFSSKWVEFQSRPGEVSQYHQRGPEVRIHNPDPAGLLQNLAALDLTHLRSIHFKGGEPMLNKDVPAVLQHLEGLGVLGKTHIKFVSNASVVHKQVLQLLQGARKVTICLSVDGVGEVQRYIRRGPSEIERIEEFVAAFATLPNINFTMNVSVMAYNVFSLDRVTEWWNGMAARYPGKFGPHSYGLAVIEPARLSVSVLFDQTRKRLVRKYRQASGADYSSVIQLLEQPFAGRRLHNEFVQSTRDSDRLNGVDVLAAIPELAEDMVLLEEPKPKAPWKIWSKPAPADPSETVVAGIRLCEAGKPRAALRLYGHFLKSEAAQASLAWQVTLHRAIALGRAREWEECVTAFQNIAQAAPQQVIDLMTASNGQRPDVGNLPAVKCLMEGPAPYRLLAEGLARGALGDTARAAERLQQALRLDPQFQAAALAKRNLAVGGVKADNGS